MSLAAQTLFQKTIAVESKFTGLNNDILRVLHQVRLFSLVVLVSVDPVLENSRGSSVYERLCGSGFHVPAISVVESMKASIKLFKLENLDIPASVKMFKASVVVGVEPGLPSTMDCAHYIPIPVTFEGMLENRKGYGEASIVAVVVEFSNQAKVVVPIDPVCIEPCGLFEETFSFTKELVLGDTTSVKCTVVQGHVPKDGDEMWVLGRGAVHDGVYFVS
ncbi:UNVERIFIED_CONTAM: hypothetical protein HDU68_011007 [Siphonaria sp. JEL0065]|nr:hypothetical protein HDU68_011007 [Siphonaria sp. JEL0065]